MKYPIVYIEKLEHYLPSEQGVELAEQLAESCNDAFDTIVESIAKDAQAKYDEQFNKLLKENVESVLEDIGFAFTGNALRIYFDGTVIRVDVPFEQFADEVIQSMDYDEYEAERADLISRLQSMIDRLNKINT
jgi:translation initiation factor 2B subunit (eIF-2B alpha/beta/delta family)